MQGSDQPQIKIDRLVFDRIRSKLIGMKYVDIA